MVNLDKLRELGIDVETGMAYCADDPEFYEEMLEEFAAESAEKAKTLADSYASKDWDSYRICAHSLKSTSKMIGAAALSENARELEMAAAAGDASTIAAAHDPFVAELNALIVVIKNNQ